MALSMTSEVFKLYKEFKKSGFPAYLTLLIFTFLLSKIAHTLLPALPQGAVAILSIGMAALSTMNSKYNFLKALVEDLEKIPSKAHYTFFLIVVVFYIIYLCWKPIFVLLKSSFKYLSYQLDKFREARKLTCQT